MGICYGQQIMAHNLGGTVRKGEKGEYGFARFQTSLGNSGPHALFKGVNDGHVLGQGGCDAVGGS